MNDEETTKRFIESRDDTTPAWRLFLLDTSGGSTEIVCSRLLTDREATRRCHEADRSRCPTIVEEARLVEYRGLTPGDSMRNFMSDSDFGPNRMFWELLTRAWEHQRMEDTRRHPRYCWVLHSRTPNAKVHKTNALGMPACSVAVGSDALERSDEIPPGWDRCWRCFHRGEHE